MKSTSKKLSCLVSPFLLGKKIYIYIYIEMKKTYLFETTRSHSHSYSVCFQVTFGAGSWRRCFLSARNVAVAEMSNPKPPGNWESSCINPANELPKQNGLHVQHISFVCHLLRYSLFQSGSYPVLSNSSTVARPPEMTELLDTPLLKISQ